MKKLIYWLCIALLIGGFIFFGTRDYKKNEKRDIRDEYELVSENNVFEYTTSSKVLDIIKNNSGIVFFGFGGNEYSNYYAKMIDEVAKENNIEKIYYYNFYEDRKNNRTNYETLVDMLDNYLITRDDFIKEIYAPSLLIVKDKTVLYFDTEYNFMPNNIKAREYFTSNVISNKKENLNIIFKQYKG